jgi:cell division septation protein DedD
LRKGGSVQSGEVIVHNYTQAPAVPTGQVVHLKPTVSTKSEPAARVGQAVSARGYVQVGTFGKSANAQTTAQQLKAMGLPVRIGKINRNGKALQIVLAGPFARSDQARQALVQVRRAGYSDAFARK